MLKYRVSSRELLSEETMSQKRPAMAYQNPLFIEDGGNIELTNLTKVGRSKLTPTSELPRRSSAVLPKISLYATPSSLRYKENVYASCGNQDSTYQSMDFREFENIDLHYIGTTELSTSVHNTSNCLTPNKFQPAPLDRSSFLRTPTKIEGQTGSIIMNIIELLGGLMSLVMNSETLICFPLFIIRWRVQGLIVYLLILFCAALPIFILEAQNGLRQWSNISAKWMSFMTVLGLALKTASLFLSAKTCALVGYSVVYTINSMYSPLPWAYCDESWGADQYCNSVGQHSHNQSWRCTLYDLPGGDCRSFQQPSHVQFWQKYVLKWDERGLRVLGELGSPNINLILSSLAVWTSLALLLFAMKKNILKIACASCFLLLLALSSLAIRNIIYADAFSSVQEVLKMRKEVIFNNADCWLESIYLIIAGTSLFVGNIRSYTSLSRWRCNMTMISLAAVMLHVLFLTICLFSILPLLPEKFDGYLLTSGKEFGYFPLALVSSSFSVYPDDSYVSFLLYLSSSLSGLCLLLGNSVNLSTFFSTLTKRRQALASALVTSLFGFLLSIPLLYETGPCLLVLYNVYGYQIPVLILGNIYVVLLIWIFKMKDLQDSRALAILWKICPLLVSASVFVLFWNWPSLPEPAPLPYWAVHLGIFFSLCSLGQVFICIAVLGTLRLCQTRR